MLIGSTQVLQGHCPLVVVGESRDILARAKSRNFPHRFAYILGVLLLVKWVNARGERIMRALIPYVLLYAAEARVGRTRAILLRANSRRRLYLSPVAPH